MYLSTKEVIQRLGISRTTLHNMRREGRFIRAHKLSERRIAFHEEELQEWLRHRALV